MTAIMGMTKASMNTITTRITHMTITRMGLMNIAVTMGTAITITVTAAMIIAATAGTTTTMVTAVMIITLTIITGISKRFLFAHFS
ncbi:hypothetical protein [Fundicoccus ignavus]|uniref:hypothetical protein n=1 Tax=Fundicoccus ignavus TaxID=2664442 RepID=UPI003CCDDABE